MNPYTRLAFPACLVIGAIVATITSWRIEPAPFDPIGGRLFPFSVSLLVLVLGLLVLLVELRTARAAAAAASPADTATPERAPASTTWIPVVALVAIIAVAIALVENDVIGLLSAVGGVIVLGSIALADWRMGAAGVARQTIVPVVAAALVVAGATFLFSQILRIPLP